MGERMEYPMLLKDAVELRASEMDMQELKKVSAAITEKYKNKSGKGSRLVTTEKEALVYAIVRMPATFGAVQAALCQALQIFKGEIRTMLDVGAGTGAAGWAADSLLELDKITCLEREPEMSKVGRQLMQDGSQALKNAVWESFDLAGNMLQKSAELVVASYMLNEMAPADRSDALLRLWHSAEKMLLIVEPGTPEGFSQLLEARSLLISEGAHVAAPCTHENTCRLSEGDWCHFTTRIQRSRMHKYLKGGDAPFEDEKFSYMVFLREDVIHSGARVLRHPVTEKGRITLSLCSPERNTTEIITKSSPLYKSARKKTCGDLLV